MLTCLRRNSALALLALVAGSTASLAEPPAILDRIPGEAPLVVVTRDLAAAAEKSKPLASLLAGQAELPGGDFAKHMEKFLAIPGVNRSGSVAVVLLHAPDAEAADMGEAPDALALVPVSDYAAFVRALGGKGEEAVTTLQFDGQDAFVRKLDDTTAVIGAVRESVEGFKAVTGQMKVFQGRMGAAGWKVADKADTIVIADAQAFKEQIEKPDGFGGQMRVPGMALPGGGGMGPVMEKVRESLARDGKTAMIGFTGNEAGLAFDFVALFREGTEAAKVFATNGDSSALLSRLPNQPYYLAGAADLSAPGVRELISEARAARQGGDEGPPSGFDAIGRNLESAEGFAMVVGANKAGPMAGVFINTAAFIATKDAKGMLEALRANADAAKETKVGGATIKINYSRDVAEASGVKFDASSTTIDPDPNDPNAFMAGMMMQTLFGNPRGFSQMAAATERGLVMTLSQNTPLMSSAIQAAQTGQGLGEEESIKAIRSQLPAQRSMEFYLGSATILDAVKTGVEEFLGEEINVPANVPPVAMAGGMEGGAVSLRLFVPNAVISAVEQLKAQFNTVNDDLEPMDDAPAKKPSSAT